MPIAKLDRSVLKLSGDNLLPWLDGLITNSLKADTTFAALLTPQGKIIADFFVTKTNEGALLDTPAKFAPDLIKRLKMYKLREKIEITDVSNDLFVYAFWDGEGDVGHVDPRQDTLGRRLISGDLLETDGDYDAHRLSLGIPDSQWDFETVSTFPADACMDLLNGVDYKKGCFVGQEVVSRMHRKTEIRKRMCGFTYESGAQPGDKIKIDDKPVATVLHTHQGHGMALVRLDKLNGTPALNHQTITIMEPIGGHTA